MNKSSREKEAVLSVFAELVRPLMRVAFEYGISASEIAGVVRRTYIQSLETRLSDQKRATTDARLAVVAGLAKSDVTALREALRAGAPHSLRASVSLDQVTNLLRSGIPTPVSPVPTDSPWSWIWFQLRTLRAAVSASSSMPPARVPMSRRC